MKQTISGVFWIFFYLLVVLSPLALIMVRPVPAGRSFWVEFSVGLGFVGLLQMAMQFFLIARYKHLTAPYGIDLILRYHRQIAIVALALLVAHPIILVVHDPSLAYRLNPIGGTWASRMGNLALYMLIALTLLSIFRKQLNIGYETWRVTHAILAVVTIVAAHLHVTLAGQYINTLWKELLLIGITAGTMSFFIYLRLIKPLLQRHRPYRLASVTPERGDVWVMELEADGHAGLTFKPGQFAWLKFGKSPFTVRENPFSFCSSPLAAGKVSFGIKAIGNFTKSLQDLPIGTRAYLDGPHGSFSIDEVPAAGYVFIAGGVGITPFISMLKTMADRGDPRPVLLFYGEQSLDSAAFRDDLAALEQQLALTVVYVLTQPSEDWQGETGYINAKVLGHHLAREGFTREYFICGPNVMTDAVEDALETLGVNLVHIHSERFNLV
ncbi:MAG: ferric reductase-like transmembrane domain-containing protein [Deinococcota bacterium]